MNEISVVGANIQSIRKLKQMSAYGLAKSAGVGLATISDIENGKRKSLNSNTLKKIAAALGVSYDDLMGTSDTISFETNNIMDIINIIDYVDDPILDQDPMTKSEKEELLYAVSMALNSIRFKRSEK